MSKKVLTKNQSLAVLNFRSLISNAQKKLYYVSSGAKTEIEHIDLLCEELCKTYKLHMSRPSGWGFK